MSKQNTKTFGILTGVLAVLVILMRLLFYVGWDLGGSYNLTPLYHAFLIGFAAMAYAGFTNRRDFVVPAGFAFLALMALIWVISFDFSVLMPRNSAIFAMLGYLCAAFITFALFTDRLPAARDICKKIWFVPALLLAIAVILAFLNFNDLHRSSLYYYRPSIFESFFRFLIQDFGALHIGTLVSLFAGLWAASSVAPEKVVRVSADGTPVATEGEGYFSVGMHILLLLLTCGIWYLIWIHRTTNYLNRTPGEQPRSATTELLLCMFVPFYLIFWTYKSAQRVDKLAASKGVPSDLSTICLVLAIFLGIVPPILLQDKINAIVTADPSRVPAPGAAWTPPAAPQYGQPVAPQYGQPVAPQYGQPVAPQYGQPVAPQYGQPVVPQYGQPVVPQYDQPAVKQQDQPQTAPAAQPDMADQIKKYKELLDSGAITQEEFDEMKRRILGL